MAKEYVRIFVDMGMCAALAVHGKESVDPAKYNPHMHILLTTREIESDGKFNLRKCREWNKRANVEKWREALAQLINREYERKGFDLRVSHKSYIRQGKNREAKKHLNRGDYEREKCGERTVRGDKNREIIARNAECERIENEYELRSRIQREIDRGHELER